MEALTQALTVSATITPEEGIIEEVDTIEIYFDVPGVSIPAGCSFDLVLPDEISFDDSVARVWGKGCFAHS